jgi:hypothetical protein
LSAVNIKIEAGFLGDAKQTAVEQRAPTLLVSGFDDVTRKKLVERVWRCVIDQDQHQRASSGTSKL